MVRRVLAEPHWQDGLTPLFYTHINPYGTFELVLDKRLDLDGPP